MYELFILGEATGQPAQNTEGTVISSEDVATGSNQSVIQVESAPADKNAPRTAPKSPMENMIQYLPFVLIFVLMYFVIFRAPKKRQQQHQQMVQSLKKNDRVKTIGGIIGTIIDVREDEVVLKVDESNNTKIRFSASAIATVLTSEENK